MRSFEIQFILINPIPVKLHANKNLTPMNAFMNFSQEHRKAVVVANPGLPVTEIAKILGSMWRSMSDKEKNTYKD